MRFVVTPEEMAALDGHTIRNIGVPGTALMERAALSVAEYVRREYEGRAVLVACGPGNNGGDGLAVARMLRLWGVPVACFAPFADYKGDALTQYNAARNLGIAFIQDIDGFRSEARACGVIVDALFGTGLGHDLEGVWAETVAVINAAGKPVVAVDIPSGIDGGTGRVRGMAVRADATVTFQYMKVGHCLYPGREYAGKLTVADIGIAEEPALFRPRRVLDAEDAAYQPRSRDTHKGNYGHVAVLAGSLGMLGAGALAARAATRGGAGLVTWLVPESLIAPASALVTEAMLLPYPDEGGRLGASSEYAILEALGGKSALVAGPGLSRAEGVPERIRHILKQIDIPMVLDADALFAVSGYPDAPGGGKRVLTPHPGEMARLLGRAVEDIAGDPVGAAEACSARYGGAAVLKGATSVVAGAGRLAFNMTGNPGMATGGAGDVLAGLTGALLAQGLEPFDAACRACWLHGRAGDIASISHGEAGLVAGDIVECLPAASGGMGFM